VFRPAEAPEIEEYSYEHESESQGLEQVPILAQPIRKQVQPQPIAVTRLEQLLSRQDGEVVEFRPAMWRSERPKRGRRAPGYLVGNIVHMALAHWECLEFSESERLRLLENYARREGVFPGALVDAVQRSNKALMDLKKHPFYEQICLAQERRHEVPFSLNTPVGILHGIIDLLYQDQNGRWYLVDWKTEWAPQANIEEIVQEHLLQMAVYTKAIQQALALQAEAALCFMVPNIKIYPLSVEKLEDAWAEVTSTE